MSQSDNGVWWALGAVGLAAGASLLVGKRAMAGEDWGTTSYEEWGVYEGGSPARGSSARGDRSDRIKRERAKGRRWFESLTHHEKWQLGDDFVLGTFEWREWFDTKPSSAFLRGAEDARLYWEMTR